MLKIIDITTLSGQVTSSQLSSANAKLVHLKCLELSFFLRFDQWRGLSPMCVTGVFVDDHICQL